MSKFDINEVMTDHNQRIMITEINPDDYSVYAIGDVHGCYQEFYNLIHHCIKHAELKEKQPVIIPLGDLIDRGPYFAAIFDLLKSRNITSLLGNHELNFYLERKGVIPCRSKARKENHERFEEYGDDVQEGILEQIGNMPNMIVINFEGGEAESPIGSFYLSHSPIRNIEQIADNGLTGIMKSFNAPQCSMRSEPIDMVALEEQFENIMMVHGHQSWNYKPIPEQDEEQKIYSNRVINLDSGCVYGNVLTALCLNDNNYIQVPAREVYHERH